LLAEGAEILGSQVKIQTSIGIRVVDHLVRLPNGRIVAVEVKSGNAALTKVQQIKNHAYPGREDHFEEGAEAVTRRNHADRNLGGKALAS